MAFHLNKFESPSFNNANNNCSKFGKILPSESGEEDFRTSFMHFTISFPREKAVALHLKIPNLNPIHLSMLCAKFGLIEIYTGITCIYIYVCVEIALSLSN